MVPQFMEGDTINTLRSRQEKVRFTGVTGGLSGLPSPEGHREFELLAEGTIDISLQHQKRLLDTSKAEKVILGVVSTSILLQQRKRVGEV
ncbi:hypothetical protein J6590_035451 [Homalodisca vitripennis]|nr:hypothetical protein J6590_035451 [Homalodisca vitripennis]